MNLASKYADAGMDEVEFEAEPARAAG
jgi:hypothetical protein